MNPALQVVTTLPLEKLWDAAGAVEASRLRWVSVDDVREMLRLGPVRFVVADIGRTLRWVPLTSCFNFWRDDVRDHLASHQEGKSLDAFPGAYCYFGSAWSGGSQPSPIVVLEKAH